MINLCSFEQHFVNSVARLLLPVDGAHASCCEEMATAMALSEASALKGLQICIDTIMAEVLLLVLVYYYYFAGRIIEAVHVKTRLLSCEQ